MAAAMAGGKGKKKKWSKGKSRDKVDNKVLFGKEQFDRFHDEFQQMAKLIAEPIARTAEHDECDAPIKMLTHNSLATLTRAPSLLQAPAFFESVFNCHTYHESTGRIGS